ncbi:carboxymuconolactone decarboxylase family protein [Actinoplanes sp. NPDC049316]|uniref:carboxymuconolactone decarboxylase family protein n=1 Tax=Actinoplanes sp. NPDC049316 TaxID=3154727 RepID=UPI00343D499F
MDIAPGRLDHGGVPHIDLPGLPGIAGLLTRYPLTARPLNELAQTLLRGPSPLTPGERETIAAYVSERNECGFCAGTHGAVARYLLDREGRAAGEATQDPRMRALLAIAEKVRQDGRNVAAEDVARAREHGADDRAVHDTVLIAAAFSMFNRYVDGLATVALPSPEAYEGHARHLAENGYLTPRPADLPQPVSVERWTPADRRPVVPPRTPWPRSSKA